MNIISKYSLSSITIILACLFTSCSNQESHSEPLRIMPLGDSITAGYTDNSKWDHPFEFGYRSGLYKELTKADISFTFVGESKEPLNNKFGDPTHGGKVLPKLDLRKVNQDKHRGYGGWGIGSIQQKIKEWMIVDKPDIILLLIGINGINPQSTKQLDSLVKTIFNANKNVKLIVAQITPYGKYRQLLFDYNTYIKDTLVPNYSAKKFNISTIDLYKHFLSNPNDPKSIDVKRLSNLHNHPANAQYDQMAKSWFEGIKEIIKK